MCSLFSFHHSVSNVLILGFFDCTKMTSAWNPILTSSLPCSLFPQNYSCTFLYLAHASVHLESFRKWSWLSALAIKLESYILFYLPFKIYGLEYDNFDCCCYVVFMFISSGPKCVHPEISFSPESHLLVLRSYSCLFIQDLLLMILWRLYEMLKFDTI